MDDTHHEAHNQFKPILSKSDFRYITRSSTALRDTDGEIQFPHFYVTAKIHKSPLKTRPIISVSGSLLHGLGKWADTTPGPWSRYTLLHRELPQPYLTTPTTAPVPTDHVFVYL